MKVVVVALLSVCLNLCHQVVGGNIYTVHLLTPDTGIFSSTGLVDRL